MMISYVVSISLVSAQNSLDGKILDQNGEALPGAVISILNSNRGAVADNEGKYEITNLPQGKQSLKVSYLGFASQTKSIWIKGKQSLDFTLVERIQALSPIVVSASKRETEAQKIATTISTLDAQAIDNLQIDNINDVGRAIPNFNTYDDGGANFPLVTVRGIATISDVPIVGIYVDDVPLFNTASFPAVLNNLERIEVLRGPQGTLYGRNSLGGVINIITKQTSNKTSGFASLSYGSLNQLQLNAGVNTPLVKDKLFLGIDGSFSRRDGYINNTFLNTTDLLGNELASGNIRLNWLLNDNWSLQVRSGFENRDINAYALVGGPGVTGAFLDSLRENHPYEVSYNTEGNYKNFLTNHALKLSYYGEKMFFKSITSAQTTSLEVRGEEFDWSPLDLNSSESDRDISTISEEIRLGSNTTGSKFGWIAGAFLYRYVYDNRGSFNTGVDNALFAPSPDIAAQYPYIQRQNSKLSQLGLSLFGNVDYNFTDKFKVSAGLRYEIENSESENRTSYSRNGDEDYSFPPLGLIPDAFEADANFSALSPKLSFSYNFSEQKMLYASVARGYRPGGINPFTTSDQDISFDPEFTWNYEMGLKTYLLQNKMRFNLTGFYIGYSDQQLLTVIDFATFNIGTQNIGKSISYGLELEWDYLLFQGLQASLNLGFLETEIQEYLVTGFGGEVNNEGNDNPYAPQWNGNFGLTYNKRIDQVDINASVDYQFQTDMFLDPENNYTQPAYGLLNARIGARYKGVELAVWGQNLTDVVYFSYGYSLTGFGGFGSYGLPRLVGTSLSYKF
ncbi:MAG: TonB-dependent receptor [Bacteroidota bacterium]